MYGQRLKHCNGYYRRV